MRRFRFSLTMLCIVVAVICALCAYAHSLHDEWHNEQRLAERLEEVTSAEVYVEATLGDPDAIEAVYTGSYSWWPESEDETYLPNSAQEPTWEQIWSERIIAINCFDKRIDAEFCQALSECRSLQILSFDGCSFDPDVLREEILPPTLCWLNLSACRVDREDLAVILNLTELKGLGLRYMRLRDDETQFLAGMQNLRFLNLDGNSQITGATIQQLSGLKSLESLRVAGLQLDDRAVATIRSLKSLTSVDVRESSLSEQQVIQLSREAKFECLSDFKFRPYDEFAELRRDTISNR